MPSTDYTRCHDDDCPERDHCWRYISRCSSQLCSHAASLRDGDGPCDYKLPVYG